MKTSKQLNASIVKEDGEWWYQQGYRRTKARVVDCQTCGKEFVTYPSGTAVFCSAECRRASCIRCGKIFQPGGANHKYCSRACKLGMATCEGCGKQFGLSKNSAGRFCSKSCFYDTTTPFGSVRPHGSAGYLIVKVPKGTPGAKVHYGPSNKSWMFQHRYVMQQKLGRPLLKTERVHHLNGRKDDNHPENLELWKRTHPAGVRSKDYLSQLSTAELEAELMRRNRDEGSGQRSTP